MEPVGVKPAGVELAGMEPASVEPDVVEPANMILHDISNTMNDYQH